MRQKINHKKIFRGNLLISIIILTCIVASCQTNGIGESNPSENGGSEINSSTFPIFVYWGDHGLHFIDYEKNQTWNLNSGIYKFNKNYGVSWDGDIFDFRTNQKIGTFNNPECIPGGSIVTYDNKWIISCSPIESGEEGFIQIWDITNQSLLKEINVGGSYPDFIISPDGKKILFSESCQLLQIIDLSTLDTIPIPERVYGNLSFSPDREYFGLVGYDKSFIGRWVDNGIEIIKNFNISVEGISLSSGGKYLGYCKDFDDFIVVERESGNLIFTVEGVCERLNESAFSPDGDFLIISYRENENEYLSIYNLNEKKLINTFGPYFAIPTNLRIEYISTNYREKWTWTPY
ncbi:MAG: WD40 repeat domain-containing protein [Anaerolineaceae bacterium]